MEKQPVKELKARTPNVEQLKLQQFNFTDVQKWSLEALTAHCRGLRKQVDTLPKEDTLGTDRELQHALFELVMRQQGTA